MEYRRVHFRSPKRHSARAGPGRRAARAPGRWTGAGFPRRRSQRAPAMSHWLFDLGNTRLKCAPLDAAGRVGPVLAIAHDGMRFDDDLSAVLPARFADACIASVAPDGLRTELLDVLAQDRKSTRLNSSH